MGGLIGFVIGATIGCYLVYSLLHWALFKRIIADRFVSHIVAAVVTYPASAVLYAYGANDGTEFQSGFVGYFLPSLLILALAFKVGRSERQKSADKAQDAVFQ